MEDSIDAAIKGICIISRCGFYTVGVYPFQWNQQPHASEYRNLLVGPLWLAEAWCDKYVCGWWRTGLCSVICAA